MDTWIVLANDQIGERHRRGLYVLKSRGMAHSNELCEFSMTNRGLNLHERASAPPGTDATNGSSQKGRNDAGL
jgi:circadian clock protein KaiC